MKCFLALYLPSCVIHTQVNLATMEMFSPVKGKLRRTHHDGVYTKFTMSERDYSISAKVGYVQVSSLWSIRLHCQGNEGMYIHTST